jgi:hypothetical protein
VAACPDSAILTLKFLHKATHEVPADWLILPVAAALSGRGYLAYADVDAIYRCQLPGTLPVNF